MIIRFIEDIVDSVGGIFNFILCVFIAVILASAFMVLVACLIAIYERL